MSKIEVDAIDKQSGSTLTLGGSGTAVTLGTGATQTGFGINSFGAVPPPMYWIPFTIAVIIPPMN